MALTPATLPSGAHYLVAIPETIEVRQTEPGMMVDIHTESTDGQVDLMLYTRNARKLRDALNAMDLGD